MKEETRLPYLFARKKKEKENPLYDPERDGKPQWSSPSRIMFGDPPIGRSALDKKRDDK